MKTITMPVVEAHQTLACKGNRYIVDASDLQWKAEEWPEQIIFCDTGKYCVVTKLSTIDGRPDLGFIYRGINHLGLTVYVEVCND